MFEIFKKLFFILTPKEQKKSIFLLGMIIIMSVIDLIGAASIMPFMAIITNPEIIQTNNYLKSIFEFSNIFGVTNEKHFMFISGIFVFLLLVISLSFKAITTYAQLRFAQMREYNISKRLLENYIGQPYSWYLNRNSADLEKNILSEVNIVVGNGLLPMLTLITQGCVAISFTVFLLLVDTLLAISVATSLTLVYWLVYFFTSKFLNSIGKERLIANGFRFKSVNQIFGAFKAIKAKHLEDTFVERFSKPAQIFAKHQTSSQIISMLPRFALEAIGFGGVILIILYLMTTNENFNTIVPIIALYVFAGYRLLPAIQIIYASSSRLKFVGPALNELSEEINNIKIFNNNKSLDNIEFNNRIAIKKN